MPESPLSQLFEDTPGAQYLAEGQSAWVYASSLEVFKVPRNPLRAARLQREAEFIALLQAAQAEASLQLPRWQRSIGPIQVYTRLPGQNWRLTQAPAPAMAQELGRWLYAFDTLGQPEREGLAALGQRGKSPEAFESAEALYQQLERSLHRALKVPQQRQIKAWFAQVCPGLYPFSLKPTSRVIHGDLWCENIMFDPDTQRLTGVIDFEDWRFSELADEMAALSYCGAAFSRAVFTHYLDSGGELQQDSADFWARVRDYRILRELKGLAWAITTEEEPEWFKLAPFF